MSIRCGADEIQVRRTLVRDEEAAEMGREQVRQRGSPGVVRFGPGGYLGSANSGFHQPGLSTYQRIVASSPSLKPVAGRKPRDRSLSPFSE